MQVEYLKVTDLVPYANNPRKNDGAVKAVAASIREFGFRVPIIVDRDNVIVAGHTRLKAAESLGMESVPVIRADDMTEEQIKAFRLADNKTAEAAEWDFEALSAELDELERLGVDMKQFGFEGEAESGGESGESNYSQKAKIPHYEPTGEDVGLSDLYDNAKAMELLADIEQSGVPDEVKQFLRFAAYRHIEFNFKNIAEFYANADAETQRLMEDSALVIIDLDDALAKGWVRMSKTVEELLEYE